MRDTSMLILQVSSTWILLAILRGMMMMKHTSRLSLAILTVAVCLPAAPALADSRVSDYLRATMSCAGLLAGNADLHAERCMGAGWRQTLNAGGAVDDATATLGSGNTASAGQPGDAASVAVPGAVVGGSPGVPAAGATPVTPVVPTGNGGAGGSGGFLIGSGGAGGSGGIVLGNGGSGGSGGGVFGNGGSGGSGGLFGGSGGKGGAAGPGGSSPVGEGGTGGAGGISGSAGGSGGSGGAAGGTGGTAGSGGAGSGGTGGTGGKGGAGGFL